MNKPNQNELTAAELRARIERQLFSNVEFLKWLIAHPAKEELPTTDEQEANWNLRDEGRSDGQGESYAERNA